MNYKSAILVRLLWRYEYYCLLNPEERTEEEIQNVISFLTDIGNNVYVFREKDKIKLCQNCHYVTDNVNKFIKAVTKGKSKQ